MIYFLFLALDWREIGFRTTPKNQLTCGSCYAFSVATSIEAQIFRRTGVLEQLSAQQIVDCSIASGNRDCTGGVVRRSLKYLQLTKGLMREKDYPYMSEVIYQKYFFQFSDCILSMYLRL